jgi:hypothetical protein
MFSGRLPDHVTQPDAQADKSILDEGAAFERSVEQQEPLADLLQRLAQAKLRLTTALNTIDTAAWVCSAPHCLPEDSVVAELDKIKIAAADAMGCLWDAFLEWGKAESAAITDIKVLFCTVDVALKGMSKQANYPANLLFRAKKTRWDHRGRAAARSGRLRDRSGRAHENHHRHRRPRATSLSRLGLEGERCGDPNPPGRR